MAKHVLLHFQVTIREKLVFNKLRTRTCPLSARYPESIASLKLPTTRFPDSR